MSDPLASPSANDGLPRKSSIPIPVLAFPEITPGLQPSSSSSNNTTVVATYMTLPSPAEEAAATRIQATFRGFQARAKYTKLRQPFLFPATGPYAAEGILPPKRALRNPVFAAVSAGTNECCSWNRDRHTIYFDLRDGFPPALEGVYKPEEWTELMRKINELLSNTHLPFCPSGFMMLLPVLGAIGFICLQDSKRSKRMPELMQIMNGETERLKQWGLKWIVRPEYEGGREGRGEVCSLVLELIMTHVALVTAQGRGSMRRHKIQPAKSRSGSRPVSRPGSGRQSMRAPRRQTMEGPLNIDGTGAATGLGSGTSGKPKRRTMEGPITLNADGTASTGTSSSKPKRRTMEGPLRISTAGGGTKTPKRRTMEGPLTIKVQAKEEVAVLAQSASQQEQPIQY